MAGTWDNESLLVLFSPFCLLSTILLQCLVMMLLPQPNNSVDKENFKNRLCWSHDIILRVQRLLTLLKCKLLAHLHQSIQIIKLLITHLLISLARRWKNCWECLVFLLPFQNRWSMCVEFTWSVTQMLHNNCDRKVSVSTCAMKLDAIVDATFINLLR